MNKSTLTLLAALLLAPLAALHAADGAREAVAKPVVFWASDPILPGQTALLFGDSIGAGVVAEGERVPDAAVSGPAERARADRRDGEKLDVLQASDLSAKVALPGKWGPGLYAIRLKNKSGESQPILLNRTEAWWWRGGSRDAAAGVTSEVAVPGEELRVFGKNLGERTKAWLAGPGGAVALETVKAEKYAVTFRLPASLAAGDYALWVHNGFGGALGFAEPLKVQVSAANPWPATVFNVRDFGARGDSLGMRGESVPDDTPAFEAALAKAAANGGGVVLVPRGTYTITGKLVIPPKTVLRGEKREWVWLQTPKEQPEFDAVLAGQGDFAVEELSIVTRTARHMVLCPDTEGHVKPDGYGRNVHLRRLMLHQLRYARRSSLPAWDPIKTEVRGPNAIVLWGPGMEIADCEVVAAGGPFHLHGAQRCRISGNRFGCGLGSYLMWGTKEIEFENNIIETRETGGGSGGFQGQAWRVHFAGNTFRHMYGLAREAWSFDSPYYAAWRGKVGKVEGDSLTGREYSGAAKVWTPGELKGQACFVTFGKGLGQYIPVADNSETTIKLARPFAVPPDETSHVAFLAVKTETVLANNTFSDASVAIQLYSSCYGLIIDGNRSERTGGMHGFAGGRGWDEKRKQFRFTICCFNQFLNNDLSQGFVYEQGHSVGGVLGPCISRVENAPSAIVGIGNVVRNNHLCDNHVTGSMEGRAHPFKLAAPAKEIGYDCRDTLIEGNTIADTPVALDVYPFHLDTLLRSNRVERAVRPLRDDGINTWIHPAERLGYQIQAIKWLLGERVNFGDIERDAGRLSGEPATAPTMAERCARVREQLWAAVARCQPQGTTPEIAAVLVGLRYELAPSPLLASGKAGKSEIAIAVRTETWSPEIGVKCELQPVPGWQINNADAKAVPPFTVVSFKSLVTVPAKNDVKKLPVRLTATWGGVPLTVVDRVDVSRRELTDWMVIGPFANVSGSVPDTSIHPPEARLDLGAEYPSLSGPVRWQPVALGNKSLDLSKLFGGSENATALAVACLRADKAVPVELSVSCQGGLQLWLREHLVATVTKEGKRIRLDLQEGDNILLCKSSVQSGAWGVQAEFKELSLDEPAHVRLVPAAELKTVKGLLPPPAKPARPGSLEHGGGVAWRQICADDFERRLIGNSWKVVSGEWGIRDGVLVGQVPSSFLAWAEKVSLPVRIEYDVRSQSPADLSCFWSREPAKIGSGYMFAFASGDAGSRILIEGKIAASSDSAPAKGVPNQWHHVIAQVLPDGKTQLFIDGKELLTARSDPKLTREAFPGLWTWGGSQFDNVRILTGEH